MIELHPNYNQGDIVILPNGWIFKIIYVSDKRDWYDIEFLYLNQNYIWQPKNRIYFCDFVTLFIPFVTLSTTVELHKLVHIKSETQIYVINNVLSYATKLSEHSKLEEVLQGYIKEKYVIKNYLNRNVSLRS